MMKKILKIAHLNIAYIYHMDSFYPLYLSQYEASEQGLCDYQMELLIEEQIIPFVHEKQQIINGRSYYQSERLDVFEVFSEDDMPLSEQIIFDKVKRKVTISINPKDVTDIFMKAYVLSGMMFLEIAQREGYMSIHASAIDYKGDAILFSAPSKTGKSTHARMWMEKFKDDVSIINDDKPLMFKDKDIFMVSGSPFSGKHGLNQNVFRPLKAIIFLEQASHDEMIKLNTTEALLRLVKNMLRPKDEETWNKLLLLINELLAVTPIYLLKATKSMSAVSLVHETLYGGM